jgi:hypothetical protein
MQFTMGPRETPEPESQDYRPLMAASPDAELPSLRGFLWAVVWVIALVLIVAQYAIEA